MSVLTCTGRLDGEALELIGAPPSAPIDDEPGEISFRGVLDPEGHISGTWTSAGGARGAFILFPDPR